MKGVRAPIAMDHKRRGTRGSKLLSGSSIKSLTVHVVYINPDPWYVPEIICLNKFSWQATMPILDVATSIINKLKETIYPIYLELSCIYIETYTHPLFFCLFILFFLQISEIPFTLQLLWNIVYDLSTF